MVVHSFVSLNFDKEWVDRLVKRKNTLQGGRNAKSENE